MNADVMYVEIRSIPFPLRLLLGGKPYHDSSCARVNSVNLAIHRGLAISRTEDPGATEKRVGKPNPN